MSEKEMSEKKKLNHPAALYIGLATGCLFGFLMCISTGILHEPPWKDLTQSGIMSGIFTASSLIGAMIGAMTGGFISDAIGPRKSLAITGLIAFVCAGGLSAQKSFWVFIVLRIISGWSVGSSSSIGPLYVGENTNPKYRGIFGSVFQISVCIGILLAYSVNYAFSFLPDGSEAWRWELLSTAFFPFLLMIGYFFIPESAGYLEKINKKAASASNFGINADPEEPEKKKSGGILTNLKEVFKAAVSDKRAFAVGIMMAIFQQITGINIILLYGPDLVVDVLPEGLSGVRVLLLIQIIIGGINLLCSFIATGLVDVLGRRFLLLTGFSLMFVGNLLFALSSLIVSLGKKNYLLAFPGIGVFLLGFEMGPGPLFFILTSELYHVDVRGRAMGIMGMLNWVSNVVVIICFPVIAKALGSNGYIFIALAVFCIVIIIFTIPVVPEMKGKVLGDTKKAGEYQEIKDEEP